MVFVMNVVKYWNLVRTEFAYAERNYAFRVLKKTDTENICAKITNQLSGLLESCGFEHPITVRASLGVLAARTTRNRSLNR